METIKPKIKKDEYELEDNYYCLIKAIEDLIKEIRRLANG